MPIIPSPPTHLTPGAPAVPHELTAEEIFVVLEGRARVRLGADESEAGPGDCIIVPADTPFALEAVGAATFAAICCFPAGGRGRLADGTELTPPWAEWAPVTRGGARAAHPASPRAA